MHRLALMAAAFLVAGTTAGAAADYPTKTITVMVPHAAGGPTDTVARLVSESMTRTLGQQLIVENQGGAGGTLGSARAARAEPDGYTLLLHHVALASSASLYRKLPFDPATSFVGVGLITDVPMTVVGKPDLKPDTIGRSPRLYPHEQGPCDLCPCRRGVGLASVRHAASGRHRRPDDHGSL